VGSTYGDALGWSDSQVGRSAALPEALKAIRERFREAMDDDLNTAAALGELFELARPLRALANRLRIGDSPSEADLGLGGRWRLLLELADVLGLKSDTSRLLTIPGSSGEAPTITGSLNIQPKTGNPIGISAPNEFSDAAIEALVEQRKAAKAARDFASADRLRAELKAEGIELVDKPGGVTVWLRG
jgi:cysteinyl-tRNA synthetase